MDENEYAKFIYQQLNSPSLTKVTMVAGCLIWGYTAAAEVVFHVSDDAMIQLATTSAMVQFKSSLPTKEVTQEEMNRYVATKQVSSWDRHADIKFQTERAMEEGRRYIWILEQIKQSFH